MPQRRAYVPDMSTPLMTAEDLLYTNVPNNRTELVRGRLVEHEPPGGKHGNVTANLGARLWTHANLTRAGAVSVGDTGFTLARNPDTVRGPDIAFIRAQRLPQPSRAPSSNSLRISRSRFSHLRIVPVKSSGRSGTGSKPARGWSGSSIQSAGS